ncbi:MAG: TatD family hydrolase [Acidobacteriota bacterium]
MIDSHAHLSMFPPPERRQILARARDAGVHTVLAPATGREDLAVVAALPEEHPGVLVALGFHPHQARELDAAARRELERALGRPGVVAVGEIGLDFHYMHSPREDQLAAFAWQLGLAAERGLPVILHHREAWEPFLAVLDGVRPVRGVAHSFTEGEAGVREVVARGLLVGISGMVTFPRADNVRAAALAVPAGSLLVETDAPFLSPVPHRGKPNEPARVTLVAQEVARLRGEELGDLERATDGAFAALFGVAFP